MCHDSVQKCKKIAESKEEMAIAKPHVSDDEEDDRPFGGVALKENKGITFSLSVCMKHTVGAFFFFSFSPITGIRYSVGS